MGTSIFLPQAARLRNVEPQSVDEEADSTGLQKFFPQFQETKQYDPVVGEISVRRFEIGRQLKRKIRDGSLEY